MLDIGCGLFLSYSRYLDILYSLDYEEMREQEDQSLAVISVSLFNAAGTTVLTDMKGEIRYINLFWERVSKELAYPSFGYISWDVYRYGEKNGGVVELDIRKLPAESEFRNKILNCAVKQARDSNMKALRLWTEKLYRIMSKYYDLYKYEKF